MENGQKSQSYICPMHPEVVSDKPGMCSECGMALVPASLKREAVDSSRHAGHPDSRAKLATGHGSTAMFLRKFWVSLALTVPVVLYSDVLRMVFGLELPGFPGSAYMPLLLGSVVFFYCGWIFLASAWREIRGHLPGMMTLIAIAISAAYFYSVYAVFGAPEHTLFWELTTLITIMLLGHWLEMRAVQGAQGALKELSKLLPDTAEVIRGERNEIISLAELREGDLIFVRPGGRIPADGVVVEGRSDVNEAMITGESLPLAKDVKSEVIAGTINGDSSLKIKVAKVGEHTFLAGVMRLVREAQASKSRLQILSDRAAFYLTIVAIAVGAITFALWLLADAGFGFAMERLVAVLVIACPHALGLAVPLVASISTTLAARQGFIVKQRLALEAARSVGIVLFDKTGTLTKGEYGVKKIITNSNLVVAGNEVLRLAASIDSHSEHFIAKAILKEARERGVKFEEAKDFARVPGKGVKGIVDGKMIFVGGSQILAELGLVLPSPMRIEADDEGRKGETIIYVVANKEVLGALALADIIRDESREAVSFLTKMGVRVAMITGDSEEVAAWVAGELGIGEYFAKVLPGEKAAKVKLLQRKGLKVAMVGDGVNDAPALTQADLGIAIGAGTNVAVESAGIILVRNDPRDIVKIIELSRRTYSKMLQNLFWATGYNIVAMPLAAGVLISKGILLQPAVAALLMSLSTVIVAVNAVLLRRLKL